MKKILVIEDEESILDNVRYFLEREKYEVFTADTGEIGLQVARTILPDLIISDIMLPGIDGLKVLEELSGDEKTALIPFIFLTAKTETSDLRKGMELGADDYIFKPFDAEELLTSVKVRLNKSQLLKNGITNSIIGELKEKKNIPQNGDDRIFISHNSSTLAVKIENIVFLGAENQYSLIYCTDKKQYLVRKPLSEWLKSLPEDQFLRIHRSFIVNIKFVKKIQKNSKLNYDVTVEYYDNKLEISKSFIKNFKNTIFGDGI
jgi:DNA-binding LytR/AlgR family response regulator